jgi:hypothetical protein
MATTATATQTATATTAMAPVMATARVPEEPEQVAATVIELAAAKVR